MRTLLPGNVISCLPPPFVLAQYTSLRVIFIKNVHFFIQEMVAYSTSQLNFNHWCVLMKSVRKKTNIDSRNVSQNAASPYVTWKKCHQQAYFWPIQKGGQYQITNELSFLVSVGEIEKKKYNFDPRNFSQNALLVMMFKCFTVDSVFEYQRKNR